MRKCPPFFSGTVTDQSNAAVSAAIVTAKNLGTGAIRGTMTDAGGHIYSILFAFRWAATKSSAKRRALPKQYEPACIWSLGQSAAVDMNLRVRRVEPCRITGNRRCATRSAVTTADVAGLVGERQIKDLPLNGPKL